MPARKRVPIGTARPVIETGIRTPGSRPEAPQRVITPPGPDRVWIGSDDPVIDVVARLAGRPSVTPPRPIYEIDQRPGRKGLDRYVGHELLEVTIPIKFDGNASGTVITGKIEALERLLQRTKSGEPPVVRILGPALRHTDIKWRVTRVEEDRDRAIYTEQGQTRYRALVTLTEHQADEILTLRDDRPKGTGIRNRSTTVRDGEDSLYDVARRVYKDRSRASDIARANPGIRLGQKLKTGRKLRLP